MLSSLPSVDNLRIYLGYNLNGHSETRRYQSMEIDNR